MNKRTLTIIKIIFIAIVVGILVKYLSMTDYDMIFKYLKEAPYVFPIVLLVTFVGNVLGTVAWQMCLGKEVKKISFAEIFLVRLVTENVSLFNPTTIVAGDGLKAILLKRKGIDGQVAVASVLIARVALIISSIFLMLTSAIYLFLRTDNGSINGWAILALVIFGIMLCLGFLMLFVHEKLYLVKFVSYLRGTFLRRWITDDTIEKVREINQDMVNFFAYSRLRMLGVFFVSILHWMAGSAEFFVILHFFNVPISFLDAIAVEVGVLAIKSIGAIIPGQIGVEEYGSKLMLQLVNVVGNEMWLIVSLIRRAKQIFWLILAGIISAIFYKKYNPPDLTDEN